MGGGCHWCTEAVFQALEGVLRVEQGYIASTGSAESFSEGVIVHYEPDEISLSDLIRIHLHTHHATSDHSFRDRYRSAVYFFEEEDRKAAQEVLERLQLDFEDKIVTQVLPLREFKASRESIQNYYQKQPEAPFCKRYIEPKLETLREKFQNQIREL